jgi:CRISPR-associated protein Cas8c/Csp2
MSDFGLENENSLTSEQLGHHIEIGLGHFRVLPSEAFEGKEKVKFTFGKIEKGKTESGIYLAPNAITGDMLAGNTWKAANDLLKKLTNEALEKTGDATMSIVPLTGEYLSFSLNGSIGRGKPKSTLLEMSLSMISTLTPYKPCLQDRGENTCIIPDLPLDELILFIRFFKEMMQHSSSSELRYGRIKKTEKGKGENVQTTYKPLRPLLFNGNFPNPPKSPALGGIALLATIGEFTKEAKYSVVAQQVIESLKDVQIYMVKYGHGTMFSYNHHIIELAKSGNLRLIVDSLYYSRLYNQSHRDYNNTEYQKFDLFTARFLQLFKKASFKDFLSFRAEYPYQVEILFNTYFIKMENIDSKIVTSARQLGKWLNLVAYFSAKTEIKEGSPNYWEKLREMKAKVLVELESSAFSAKTGDALMAQVITRAGRLSGMDVPAEADLFMEKAMSGEIKLEQAQNLIIAFSRLKNAKEIKDKVPTPEDEFELSETGINENI